MNGGTVRFGVFEFTPASGELSREGRAVKLQAQPGRVLAVLVAQAGTVVSRETLQREVWGTETHVDFERGLNFCIAQIRTALRDSADSPRFIATVPKQGYRFIAPVEVVGGGGHEAGRHDDGRDGAGRRPAYLVATAVVALIALAIGWPLWGRATKPRDTVIVVPFYNETGRPDLDRVATSLSDLTVARLAAPDRLAQLSVIGNAPALRNPFARSDVQEIATGFGAQWVVIGQLKADDSGLRVIAHLIRSDDMKHIWADTFDAASGSLPAQEQAAEAIAAAVSRALASH